MNQLNNHSSHKRSNEGYVLLMSLLVMVVLTLLLGAAMLNSQMQLKEARHRIAMEEAIYSAEAGLHRAIFELRRNAEWRPGQSTYESVEEIPLTSDDQDGQPVTHGYYSLQVQDGAEVNGWNTCWIRALGEDSHKEKARVIMARVLIESPSRFMVSTLGDLRVGSGAVLDADILAQDVYFDVNDTLPSPDNEIHVDGDVYYIRSVEGEENPAVVFGSESQLRESPSITFAGVDVDYYRSLVQALESTGEAIFQDESSTIDLENLEEYNTQSLEGFDPKIIFSEGDIHIRGQFENSVLVVAGGHIYIEGDIEPLMQNEDVLRPQIGLFASDDVIIPETAETDDGNLTIEAFVMADGQSESADGRFVAEAANYSLETLNFSGAISVRGKGRTAVDLNAFKNRSYQFNQDLNQNRAIPFTPFIVNVISWDEASRHDSFPPN